MGKDYQRPTAGDKLLAFVIRFLPKIGPLRILTFRTPTPEAQKLFENSFNTTIDRYRSLLGKLENGQLQIPNDNFDVGEVTARGKYKLSDKTCAELLERLSKQHMAGVDHELKVQLLAFYAVKDNPSPPARPGKAAAKIRKELAELRQAASTTSVNVAQ